MTNPVLVPERGALVVGPVRGAVGPPAATVGPPDAVVRAARVLLDVSLDLLFPVDEAVVWVLNQDVVVVHPCVVDLFEARLVYWDVVWL